MEKEASVAESGKPPPPVILAAGNGLSCLPFVHVPTIRELNASRHRTVTGAERSTRGRICAILYHDCAKWQTMTKSKPPSRRVRSSRPKPRGKTGSAPDEAALAGFRSPAHAYDHGEAPLIEGIPAKEPPRAPAVRATPGALRSLEARGYSQDEIFALVVPRRTFARRQKRRELLTVEETDKAIRLARVAELADHVFGDRTKAHRWLRKPKGSLDRETPLAYLASEAGARLVEEMLHRIDSGIIS
jgi:putative toxin-antitoxin system antitoxin component (TIGR02293 family)